jgi:hypothetical protein
MKLILIFLLLLIVSETSAQLLTQELYSKNGSEANSVDFGKITSINDTLAILDFYNSNRHNSQIVAKYQFRNDSLIVTELDTVIELNRRVECTYNEWMDEKNFISISYGPHYFNRGYIYFDTLTFEVDGVRHRAQIGTAVNFIHIERPMKDQFLIKVYDDSVTIDSFEVRLPKERNTILFDKEIIETSYSHFGSTTIFPTPIESAKLIQELLPDYLTIDGKVYKIIVRLIPKETNFRIE